MATYTVEATTAIALAAATAKSVLSYICATGTPAKLIEWSLSFDGASASATPVLIEVCLSTQAGAGTTTSQSPIQSGGAPRTVQGTGARNYTAEPTALTVLKRYYCHPQAGMVMQYPLGREVQQTTTADAIILRVTAPAIVNVTGYIEIEEG